MNHLEDDICIYCGSTLYARSSKPHCSGDNLKSTKAIFDEILDLEGDNPKEFQSRMLVLRENEGSFDLFMDYWRRKGKDSKASIRCIHEENYRRTISPESYELPMPDRHIDYPDLAEVYIAEIMLDRELTDLEKDGSRYIPKIGSKADVIEINKKREQKNKTPYETRPVDLTSTAYLAPLTWIKYPHSYMSQVKATDKILSLEPLPKVFDIEAIRGIYKDRRGDSIDE